ncbi:MAG: glycosyltransferase family 1 protein [Cumulibacter sp.]
MSFTETVQRKAKTARRVLSERGLRGIAETTMEKVRPPQPTPRQQIQMLVRPEDAARVDWATPHPAVVDPLTVSGRPLRTAWIMSPPGRGSGGHQNLFRFISYLESAGHSASIHLYSAGGVAGLDDLRRMVAETSSYADVRAPIWPYDPNQGVGEGVDAIFATGWETAYPSYLDSSTARRFYFVQDYEPSFYAISSESVLAESTYRFGFHGITAGNWLASKLSNDYEMECDAFEFASDSRHYSVVNSGRRPEIFFYARPVTPRRAFELGILALQQVNKLRPDIKINLAGWDVSHYDLPFECVNHGELEISKLNAIYNRCSAALVLSLTNMSLLPLELLSAGVVPVVNEGPNNSMVTDNPFIRYVSTSPAAIARSIIDVIEANSSGVLNPAEVSASVTTTSWDESGRQFVSAFERSMHG